MLGPVDALEANLWSMWRQFGNGPGCSLVDRPDVLAYETPIPAVPYNTVLRFRAIDDVERRLDEALTPYRRRGVPVVWLVHPTVEPPDIRERLAARGFVQAEVLAGMVAALDDLDPPGPPPPGVEVRAVSGADDGAFVGLVSWRYDLEPEQTDRVGAIFRANGFGEAGSPNHAWVATLDGEPVSKVTMHVSGDTAGIYGLATTPAARGLGLGRLLTLTAYEAARAVGATTAVLHSTPMAVSLYEALGFTRAADFELWAEPGRLEL